MTVIEVRGGRLRGRDHDGLQTFLGIPYAEPPVGRLRFRPPQDVQAWSGVRDAGAFGPASRQPPPTAGFTLAGDPAHQSEDCLTLNVWSPSSRAPMPVLVWIHGGGFTTGTGSAPLYRGDTLARSAGLVVVTINYRLGALGFLGHPALALGGTGQLGNYGLADQVAALRWVRDNIAAFGGDPDNVTVFGESAGAMSISALLAAPSASGLFRRAVIESGPPYAYSLDEATKVGDEFCRLLGLHDPTREILESVPADDLVAAGEALHRPVPEPGHLPLRFLPVIDGAFLPRPILEAVAAGSAADVGLIVGTNRDELTLFALGDPTRLVDDGHGLRRRIAHAAPQADVDEVVEAYESARRARGEPLTPQAMWTAIGTDRVFRWPSLQLAAAQRHWQPATYVYLFTWESPAFGGTLGSCHGLEIPFVFRTVDRPVISDLVGGGPEAEALSVRMSGSVEAFARTGDPSHEGIGLWPAWDAGDRTTMVFGPGGGVARRPRDEELAAWESVLPLPAS
jgi:para-nitrobenzyl esterase